MTVAAGRNAGEDTHRTLRVLALARVPAPLVVSTDEVLLRLRAEGQIPDTLAFHQCVPEAVLIGLHQPVDLEVRERFTTANGIAIARRITGGGAVLAGDAQLLWTLVIGAGTDAGSSERVLESLAGAIRSLCSHDVEIDQGHLIVGGRRIGSSWATSSRGVALIQGFLQLRDSVPRMVDALRAPAEKMPHKDLEVVRQRWTDLERILGRPVDATEVAGVLASALAEGMDAGQLESSLTPMESARAQAGLARFGDNQWIRRVRTPPAGSGRLRSLYKAPGGFLWTYVTIGPDQRTITRVDITGDISCNPLGALADLCTALEDCPNEEEAVAGRIAAFYRERAPETPGFGPEHLTKAVVEAAARTRVAAEWHVTPEEANDIWLVPATPGQARAETLASVRQADVMLMPYCSKALECELRYTLDCTSCGGCSTGVGYALARQRGMSVVTLCNAEHFKKTLGAMKEVGTKGYIGACCEPFYAKHREEFEQLGVPGLLLNIEKVTCYEVDIDRDDRNVSWKELTDLKVGLLKHVMEQVAPQETPNGFAGIPVPAGVKETKDKGSGKRNSPQSPV